MDAQVYVRGIYMSLKPVSGKIESQEINDNFSYLDSEKVSRQELAEMTNGITEVFETFEELEAEYPNGKEGLFLVVKDGHIYYWKDEWKDAGKYQSTDWLDYMTEQDEEWVI